MSIEIEIPVKVISFPVPDSIMCEGMSEGYYLKDLKWKTLNSLCEEFRQSVFKKAGMKDYKSS